MSYLRQLLDPAVIPAWVQALGSVFAIVWSVKEVDRKNRFNIATEKRKSDEEYVKKIENLHVLIRHANDNLNALCERDDEHALARYWREKVNDSVPLALAQIQYDLDQLMS